MISVRGLTKRYGGRLAVDDLTFDIRPGMVTGFLGPNGSGKSTTMRLILGLAAPDAGTALVGGVPYRSLPWPSRTVGAVLISSHLISEMALTADRLIVIGSGRLLADTTVADLSARGGGSLEEAFLALTEGSMA